MAWSTKPHGSAKQTWQVGDAVNVGFLKGLEVVKKIPTPGDYAPDAYALWQPGTDRFYRFVPHKGIARCFNLAEACAA
jgi:hypothetical protein